MPNKLHPLQLKRHITQAVFMLVFIIWLLVVVLAAKSSIHALCLYATVCFGLGKAGIFTAAAGIFGITILVSLLVLIITIFRGREFCAYVCPLGTMQEAIFSLRSLKYRKKQTLSYIYENKFNKLKYFILIITSILSYIGIGYIYIRLCPIYALSLLIRMLAPGLAVMLLLVVLPAFFLNRFWCRFLCPFAALMNAFQALGKLFGLKRRKILRNLERCVDCGICSACCPMNIDIAAEEYVQSPECIHCYLCACKCPKPGTFCCKKED